jgi:hypothetical protein
MDPRGGDKKKRERKGNEEKAGEEGKRKGQGHLGVA